MNAGIFFLIAVSVGIAGAASTNYLWDPYPTNNRPSPDRYNYFDAELLEVFARIGDGNFVVSPLAVKVALEMIMEGAAGRSAEEIKAALRRNTEDGSNGMESSQQIYKSLQAGTKTDILKFATMMVVSRRYQINPEYKMLLVRNFRSGIEQPSFQQPRKLSERINDWVIRETSGLITRLVDERSIDPQAKLMLLNAVYFKGKWLNSFAKENTRSKCFSTELGDCINVAMMTATGSYEYAYIPRLDAHAINMPYQDGRFSILLVLPNKYNGCRQLIRDMPHVGLDEVISRLQKQEVHVEIPKFTVETRVDLREYLQQLQINQIFTPQANLSRIFGDSNENTLINQIIHSAKLEVNEEGTEAAAVIGSLFVPLMGGTPTTFIADHPFLFFVRDTETGSVLFSGRIERPEYQSYLYAQGGVIESNFAPDNIKRTEVNTEKIAQAPPMKARSRFPPSPGRRGWTENQMVYNGETRYPRPETGTHEQRQYIIVRNGRIQKNVRGTSGDGITFAIPGFNSKPNASV